MEMIEVEVNLNDVDRSYVWSVDCAFHTIQKRREISHLSY